MLVPSTGDSILDHCVLVPSTVDSLLDRRILVLSTVALHIGQYSVC